MIDYASINADATEAILEAGVLCTLQRTAQDGSITQRTFTAVFIEKVDTSNMTLDNGVRGGDWKLIAQSTAQVQNGDVVDCNGTRYMVVHNEPVWPGGISVAEYVWLRP